MKTLSVLVLCGVALLGCQPSREKSTATDSLAVTEPAPERNPAVFQERFSRGIDFAATGNEPFWSVDIDFDGSIHFKNMEGAELIVPTPPGEKAADADVTRYTASGDNGSITIELIRQECTDTMSGFVSEFVTKVEVTLPGAEPITYEGCGQYLFDQRLHGDWRLVRINETQLDSTQFAKGLPQLSFDLPQKRVYGHTGCNSISGSIEVQGQRIVFAPMIATKMACPGMEFEYDYLRWFPGTIPYQLKDNQLHLMVSTDSTFVYEKKN
ncbi:MAG TPA: META domain-containing protein [Cyclobacteriaceae bacterium]